MINNSMKKTCDEPLSQIAVQYNRDITEKQETRGLFKKISKMLLIKIH